MSARKKASTRSSGPKKAARLPSGQYGWRGRAVPFSKLPKAERSRFRGVWAAKATKTRAREKAIAKREPQARASDRKAARDWINRRTVKVNQQIEHSRKGKKKGLPSAMRGSEALKTLGPKAILAARELQRAAHKAYVRSGSKGGGRALKAADQIRDALGPQLAAALPQLWYYH
jgi:hypothetical protein